tara:strand:+ start:806 stop:1219 length:414 start_codon:yes stop_codon:yes gene_type:complete
MSQPVSANLQNRLQWSLFSLRLSIFIVMFMWTMDKFVNPAHGALVLKAFYGINESSNTLFYILGALQLLLVLAFVTGIKKRISYGLILLIHASSTFASFPRYIDGFNNLLFFAAWPMLGACLALYLLRDADVKFTVK